MIERSLLPARTIALGIFVACLSVRLIALWRFLHSSYTAPLTGDMKFYVEWASRIAAGQWTDFHAFYGEPLYAYLLAPILFFASQSSVWIFLLQAVADAGTAVLIFKIGEFIFAESIPRGRFVGLLAAIGWIFFAPAAGYSLLFISTSFVVAIYWFCFWWLMRRSRRARWAEWLSIGFLIGLAAMFSAASLILLPLFFLSSLGRRHWAILGLGVALGTAPAWGHNLFVARDPVFLSAHGGLNFWIGNNPEANGYPKIPTGLPSDQALLLQRSIQIAETAAGHPLPRSAVSRFWSSKARDYIATHFLAWLDLLGAKLKNFWNNLQYDDLSSITALRDAGVILPGLRFGFVAVLGLPGIFFAARNRQARWIIAAVLLQMIALLPVFVNERYRLPAVPGLLLLSAFFVDEMRAQILARHWAALCLSAGALAASSICVFSSPNDPALRSIDDYKAAERELLANDFAHAEKRLRLACAEVVRPDQVEPAVAQIFAESARQKWRAGDPGSARLTIDAALRLDPGNESLRKWRDSSRPR